MKTLAELQKDYAELIVKAGLNVQKGQRLVINCPVDEAFFARLCAKAAYEAGCKEVVMRWADDELTKYKYLYADDEIFDKVDTWVVDMLDTLSLEGAAFLSIYAEDPENLKDADPDRIKRAQISSGK
ncbi:MAG: aminopeptidase, partial [Firmicutes bacterium]|nr:aminopeptidase [Bacillota bacterium]